MQLLDSVRLLAAVGVIVAHIMTELYPGDPLWIVGSFSVPFYLFVALYFTVRGFKKDSDRGVGRYLIGRLIKLYLPFLVWNVAYELMHLVKYPDDPLPSPVTLLWAATYAHLYFLPLLMIATTIVVLSIRPILASVGFRIGLSVVMAAIGAFAAYGAQLPELPSDPSPQIETLWHMHRTIAPACIAVIFAIWAGTRTSRFVVPLKTGLLGLALMMVALAFQVQYSPHPMWRSLSGFGLVLIAFTPFYTPVLKPAAWLGRYSYGIYLSHIAFIRIAMTAANYFDLPRNDLFAIGVGVFAFTCGAVMTIILSQSKWTAWIVGCDVSPKRRERSVASTIRVPSEALVTPAIVSPPQTVRLQTPDPIQNVPH